jgi:hypothetical protein
MYGLDDAPADACKEWVTPSRESQT